MSENTSIPMVAADVAVVAAVAAPTDWARCMYDGTNLYVPADIYSKIAAIDVAAAHKTALLTYANSKQWLIATGGCTLTVGGQQITFTTTLDGLAMMNGKATRLQQPNPPSTITWQTGPTTFVSIAAADFSTAATAVADFVQSTFDKLAALVPQIESGSVTTTAQVDGALG